MNEPARPVPQWVWVVASIALIGGLALATCAVGVGVLAPRVSKTGAARGSGSADPVPLSASDDDFVMVTADRTQAPADIFAAAAVSAAARSLKPFVYATATWCAPCKKLNASLSDPRMKDAFKGTYVVKLDIDEFDEKTLSAMGVRVRAVPSFYELGPSGTPTGRMLIGDWGPDVPENMAPALKSFFSDRAR
jgi:thiol-disulfide isomerase/thioredoxin